MKKEIIMPVVVLAVICLVITAALAFTNSTTAPVIALAAEERAEAARHEAIPDATGFTKLDVEGLPETIKEVYASDNQVGYVFMVTTKGYGGDMELICSVVNNGRILMCKTLKHSETKGMGSKTADEPFRSQFIGKDAELEGVNAVTGATISSTAYINAIHDVFTAYEMVKGA